MVDGFSGTISRLEINLPAGIKTVLRLLKNDLETLLFRTGGSLWRTVELI